MNYGLYAMVAGYLAVGFAFHFLDDPLHHYIDMPKWCVKALFALFGLGLGAIVVGLFVAVLLP